MEKEEMSNSPRDDEEAPEEDRDLETAPQEPEAEDVLPAMIQLPRHRHKRRSSSPESAKKKKKKTGHSKKAAANDWGSGTDSDSSRKRSTTPRSRSPSMPPGPLSESAESLRQYLVALREKNVGTKSEQYPICLQTWNWLVSYQVTHPSHTTVAAYVDLKRAHPLVLGGQKTRTVPSSVVFGRIIKACERFASIRSQCRPLLTEGGGGDRRTMSSAWQGLATQAMDRVLSAIEGPPSLYTIEAMLQTEPGQKKLNDSRGWLDTFVRTYQTHHSHEEPIVRRPPSPPPLPAAKAPSAPAAALMAPAWNNIVASVEARPTPALPLLSLHAPQSMGQSLFSEEKTRDWTIVTQENKQIRLHGCILAFRCPDFFSRHEANKTHVDGTGFTEEDWKSLVHLLYLEEFVPSPHRLLDQFRLIKEVGCTELLAQCMKPNDALVMSTSLLVVVCAVYSGTERQVVLRSLLNKNPTLRIDPLSLESFLSLLR